MLHDEHAPILQDGYLIMYARGRGRDINRGTVTAIAINCSICPDDMLFDGPHIDFVNLMNNSVTSPSSHIIQISNGILNAVDYFSVALIFFSLLLYEIAMDFIEIVCIQIVRQNRD